MTLDEAVVMGVIRDWYDKKPHPNRVLTRPVLEELLPDSIEWDRQSRIKLTKIVSSRFPAYPTNKETRAWLISQEGLP